MMTVLVTGATGRVGGRLVPRLLEAGEAVRVLARDPDRAETLRERGAEAFEGDLRDGADLVPALEGASAVIHLAAAFRGVPDEEAVAVNERATVALARASVAAGIERLVFASTNLVYGPGRGPPAREDDEPAADDAYGVYPRTKLAAERALADLHCSSRLDLRVLRLAFVYGDGDPHLGESLRWARDWPAHKRLHLVHHADVAQAFIRALRADGLGGATFNVADDAPISAVELLELNGERAAADAALRTLDDPWEGIVDTTAARAALAFRPIYPSVYTARDAGAL
jgi:nucleoside-diphosphate-sugar epimerase